MNHIFTITKNNLFLSQRAINTFKNQDIPVKIHVFDNVSRDETQEWLKTQDVVDHSTGDDLGVSAAWNLVLDKLFYEWDAEHVLVANNDVAIPSWMYSELLSYNQPFITGVADNNESVVNAPRPTERMPLDPHPDFSLFLIRKDAWQTIGHFDEDMILYCSDCSYHLRGHRLGVEMYKICTPYFHINSSTMRLATENERRRIQMRANIDREVFKMKYGCLPGTDEYNALFHPKFFGSEIASI